jgi:hypothetical protein
MTTVDGFRNSGLDYMDWANKMVAEGKMYWPANRTSRLSVDDQFDIGNIVCEIIVGDASSKANAETKFCNNLQVYSSNTLLLAEYILEGGLCEDNGNCELLMQIGFQVGGIFLNNVVGTYCTLAYAAIAQDCDGAGNGGAAAIEVNGVAGEIFSLWDDANQNSCSANTQTTVCQQSTF